MENLYRETVANCILKDIKACLESGAAAGAILLTYCAMDAMAFLSMPKGKDFTEKKEFMSWAKKYMETDPAQSYQYDAKDLYGTRCGFAHSYGAESAMSKAGLCKLLTYHLGSKDHIYRPEVNPNMAILSVKRFILDFFDAVDRFSADVEANEDLRPLVESRLPRLFRIVNYAKDGRDLNIPSD